MKLVRRAGFDLAMADADALSDSEAVHGIGSHLQPGYSDSLKFNS